ncbi:phospho-acceptor domain-containing protein [Ulvibacter sp. MAR_2010_11]|uniref:ATP-binding protein n=1 Tax=Ulvibacter sp. MAR_2010_11 TaxID=1250229 RepID=UPI000C2C3D64|nr:ATP-binding protein [Ulvibacter sp. MAR_2010_11]PKA83101.1 phospho-acceptor domain-containing protein [Ulvibacter sp. MAR_2010_11]
MKLTEKIKTEVLKDYDIWIYSYLNGDVDTYDSFLDDDYHFIGSAKNEEFLNRKDTTQFFADTGDEFAGKTQLRNETKTLEQFGELIFMTHLFDGWFLHEKVWTFYARFRFSSALRKNKDGWRFVYQHFSIPDSKTEDGGTIGYDKINEENQELREAIQRRTFELEAKNRDLEIESALERVRAIAMSMHTSEELIDVCKVVFTELQKLGFDELRNTMIHTFVDEKQYFINYDYSDATGKNIVQIPYKGNPAVEKFVKAIRKSNNAFHHLAITGKELNDWKKFRKDNNEFDDPRLEKIASLHYYNYSVGASGIGISTYSAISKEKKELLQRFRNVFQLAYQRFTDISLAEAQAREAQIDLALERIRSQATSMKESSDLLDIVVTMRTEFTKLGHEAHYFWHMMWLEDTYEKAMTSGDGTKIGFVMELPRHIHGDIPLLAKWEKSKKPIVVYAMDADEAIDYVDKMVSLGDFKNIDPQAPSSNDIRHIGGLTFIMARTTHGEIGYSLPGVVKNPPEKDLEILEKFAGAFDLAHRRFLDLQNAEKQAREVRIELALEKVRSRSMAMQSSEELLEAGALLYRELSNLGVPHLTTGYVLFDEKAHIGYSYGVNPADGSIRHQPVEMIHTDTKVMKSIVKSWKKQEPLLVMELSPSETIKHQTFIAERSKNFPLTAAQLLAISPESLIIHCFNFKQGYLLIVGGIRLTEEQQNMVVRFANVFQQTYTRFLDLQKAEAQAREGQIETALEKVRSRSMGMQKSDEIGDVAKVLFEQLIRLGGSLWGTGFGFCEKKSDVDDFWFVNEKGVMPPLKIPHTEDPAHIAMYHGWLDKLEILSITKDGAELEDHYNYMLTVPDVQPIFRGMLDSGLAFPTWQKWHAAYFKYGYLLVITTKPYKEEAIFKRFAKVFEQSYTRFLDLQKSEAQSRESQIELALERVRARTMAMQKSEELKDVIQVVYDQFVKLKIHTEHAGFLLDYKERDDMHIWLADKNEIQSEIFLPYFDCAHWNSFKEAKKKGENFFANQLSLKEKNKFYRDLFKFIPDVPKSVLDTYLSYPALAISTVLLDNVGLYIENFDGIPYSEEENEILLRFGKVFQQTYTRFLDLQKAEAQAREAQIEASLEKVRSVALGLQKSDDMLDIAKVLYEQLLTLGFSEIRNAIIDIHNDETETFIDYDYSHDMSSAITQFSFYGDPVIEQQIKKIASSNDAFFEIELKGKELDELIETRLRNGEKDDPRLRNIDHLTYNLYSFGNGAIGISNFGILSNDQKIVLKRFRNVFTFAYKRYTDLAYAEAQAREAKIEASLEKVRSTALGMQKSDDMLDIAQVLYEQLVELGFTEIRNAIIDLHNDDNETFWDYDYSDEMSGTITLMRYDDDPIIEKQLKAIVASTDAFFEIVLEGKELQDLIDMRLKNGEDEDPRLDKIDQLTYNLYSFGNGAIGISNFGILSDENKIILRRFRNVFTFAYKRYTDLHKAELQAREAQIEAALEKVRSRSLAMQKPDELQEVVAVVAEKLKELGVIFDAGGVILCTYFPDNKDVVHWIVTPDFSSSGRYLVPYFDNQIFSEAWDSKIRGDAYFSKEYSVETKNHFFEHAFEHSDYRQMPEDYKKFVLQAENHRLSAAWSKNSAILIPSLTGAVPSESDAEIMKRFANVFEQAYIRFMDLQKAEVRARETQIDIALERVRSRTLAMQTSEELSETAVVVFKQLIDLGIEPNRLYIGIIKEDNGLIEMWATDEDGNKIESKTIFDSSKNKSVAKIFDAWKKKKKSLSLVMEGKELSSYLKYLNEELHISVTKSNSQKKRYQSIGFFSKGFIGIAAPEEQPEETTKLLERFAAVFNLTYTRFNDLLIAEAQTREARIESALERVRARALAMQTPEELKEVATTLRTEMGLLGVEELETCSIYIHDENTKKTECWYAINDIRSKTKKLVTDHFKLNLNDTWVGREMLKLYNSKSPYASIVMTGDNRIEWIRYCEVLSKPFKGHYGEVIPDRTYHLYKFSHGAIGVATPSEISEENWGLLKRAASVFSLAYSRFKDLTQARLDLQLLKEEKKKAEDALSELQLTQTQLIQSEKMASLGELTAGIAHEIQNPLNFVNNFSEVSNELLDEMLEEMTAGNMEDVKELMNDIKQNLEKINHHGKRADGIVKGMLQHSRKSTLEKEPTDINKLADEYLRLAYHGLRAKDKSFNATLETDFDEAIGKVSVIPQDIGRVILNLITNAFYACNERKKMFQAEPVEAHKDYTPTVSVSTKKENGHVIISVKDNGNGIPKHVIDKIYQPFFTTKPTGEGTGLGLSMSYDIVTKGHGGELKVETEEGEGTLFTIAIPK